MRYFLLLLPLLIACTQQEKAEFDTKELSALFETEKVEADFFSLGTDRGAMLLVDIEKSPIINGDSVDMGNLISTAAYLSYMQLKEKKMDAEKIRISAYKKVPGNTEEYFRDFPIDSLDMASRYYSGLLERLRSLKRGEYAGMQELLDKKLIGPAADTMYQEIHDELFELHGPIQNISFAGFDYGEREGIPFFSVTGDYDFAKGRVPFLYVFAKGEMRVIGFYIAG